MLPIDAGTAEDTVTYDSYVSAYPAPKRGELKPSQIVLSNAAVGFLPVPTRLDNSVELIYSDEPLLALQAMQVDYRVNVMSDSIESELAAASQAARAAEASRTW